MRNSTPDGRRKATTAEAAEAIDTPQITSALKALRHNRLKFPPPLEAAFDGAMAASRTRHYQVWLRAMAVINLPTIYIARQAEPEYFHLAIFLQLGLIVPACLLGAWGLPRLPRIIKVLYVTALNTLVVFMLCQLGAFAPEPFASRYFMAAGITIMCANIVIPIGFSAAAMATIPPASMFCLFTLGGFGGLTPLHNAAIAGFMLMLLALSLNVRRGVEKLSRRSYLLGVRDQLLVDELRTANERLAAVAATDGLTGVANRRFFDAALDRCWQAATATGTPLSVIMIDIDHFKSLNDTAGHASGDSCLRAVAQTIAGSVRTGVDMVARYGGEEFAIILPDTNLHTAQRIANRVKQAVQDAAIAHPGKPTCMLTSEIAKPIISVSIGVAQTITEQSTGPQRVLNQADRALYSAKASGRDRIVLAGP